MVKKSHEITDEEFVEIYERTLSNPFMAELVRLVAGAKHPEFLERGRKLRAEHPEFFEDGG